MTEPKNREIRFLLMNGSRIHLTRRELQHFLISSRVLTLLSVLLLFLAVSNPTLFPTLPTYTSRLFYWGICIVLYVFLMPFWLEAVYTAWNRFTQKPIPQILATGPLILALTGVAIFMQGQLDSIIPRPGGGATWTTWVKNLIIGHLVELAGALWLLPLFRSEQPRQHPDGPEETPKETPLFVVFNGRSVPLRSIQTVKSAEHHLVVTMEHRTTEFRAKLKDFLGQVCEETGIQTHRSYWVSKNEALELQGSVVLTRSGEKIPVSRGRMDDVKKWFHEHGKPH